MCALLLSDHPLGQKPAKEKATGDPPSLRFRQQKPRQQLAFQKL